MTGRGGVRCALMRGGSSKGAFFLAGDLPAEPAERDDLLLRLMGSPDPRQIDGIGGAHPLTSKVAVVSASPDAQADVDYLFLQVAVDAPEVSDGQTCGNLLAAVAPFAIERGLVPAAGPETTVRVRLLNTGALASVTVRTPGGVVEESGDTLVAGVPFPGAPVVVGVEASTRPLLPTGHARDDLVGVSVTCIDAGMPSVLVAAADLGVTGDEAPADLEAEAALTARVADLHAAAFAAMGLPGEAATATVPKVVLLAAPRDGGTIATRSFIPRRVHQAVGVLGAASVGAACRVPGSVAADLADPATGRPDRIRIEHPTGHVEVEVPVLDDAPDQAGAESTTVAPRLGAVGVVRTARLLFDGVAYPRP